MNTIQKSQHDVFQDSGPWVQSLPRMWRMVAWPHGPERPFPRPWKIVRGEVETSPDVDRRIRFWSPLLHLMWWSFGWSDPALGALRTAQFDDYDPSPSMQALRRWWGLDALAVCLWQAETNRDLIQHREMAVHDRQERNQHLLAVYSQPQRDKWRTIFQGGMDGLHLISHSESPIWLSDGSGDMLPVTTGPPRQQADGVGHVLLLDRYSGWYRALERVGDSIGSHDACVEVVVTPIGYLGRFRKSPATGVWHSVSEEEHLLGWQ